MRNFVRHVLVGLVPVLFVLLITLFNSVLIADWRYAHKSHAVYQDPFNWALYKSEIVIFKFIRSLFYDENKGLPLVKLYISEKSQRQLLRNTP